MKTDKPLIQSWLDFDFYKLTMGYVDWLDHPEVQVKFGYANRDPRVRPADYISLEALREQIDHVLGLRLSRAGYRYLQSLKIRDRRMFPDGYLDFLTNLESSHYHLEVVDGDFRLEFAGRAPIVSFLETTSMSIMTEMFAREYARRQGISWERVGEIAIERLMEKIAVLKQFPEITFSDFGSRRRVGFEIQKKIDHILAEELPKQFLGTSDVYIAMLLGISPVGTNAHQQQMQKVALAKGDEQKMRRAVYNALDRFFEVYGFDLAIALSDTYGTDGYLDGMTHEQVLQCRGYRQDSMEPIRYGEKVIQHLSKHHVDPMSRLVLFSDGLELESMISYYFHFRDRLKTSNGWGTHLTNDVGFPILKIVIKLIEANGYPAVKLSDNLDKAIGDSEEKERCMRVFGYSNDYRQEVTC